MPASTDFPPELMPTVTCDPVLTELLAAERFCELGAGQPVEAIRPRLVGLWNRGRFANLEVIDESQVRACQAGLWLRFDFLDESHSVSQELPGPTGSYWHAIMHRREGDFGNAKYWFRQVGRHPVFEPLAVAACETIAHYEQEFGAVPAACRFLSESKLWDPYRFVDLCEGVTGGRVNADRLCRLVQQYEWQLLFDDCFRQAVKLP